MAAAQLGNAPANSDLSTFEMSLLFVILINKTLKTLFKNDIVFVVCVICNGIPYFNPAFCILVFTVTVALIARPDKTTFCTIVGALPIYKPLKIPVPDWIKAWETPHFSWNFARIYGIASSSPCPM